MTNRNKEANMSDKTFNYLRDFAGVWSFIAVFIAGVFTAWKLPNAEAVGLTLTGITACLNGIVMYFRKAYNKPGVDDEA